MKESIPICLYDDSPRDGKWLPKVKQKGRTLPWKNIMAALSWEDVQNCAWKDLKTSKWNVEKNSRKRRHERIQVNSGVYRQNESSLSSSVCM